MEIELDLWALVEEMLPGLIEIERIEALAAGKTEADDPFADGQEEADQGPEGHEGNDA